MHRFAAAFAVNNAGRNVRKPTLQYTEEDYQAVMGTNLESAFSLCQVCTGSSPALGSKLHQTAPSAESRAECYGVRTSA